MVLLQTIVIDRLDVSPKEICKDQQEAEVNELVEELVAVKEKHEQPKEKERHDEAAQVNA